MVYVIRSESLRFRKVHITCEVKCGITALSKNLTYLEFFASVQKQHNKLRYRPNTQDSMLSEVRSKQSFLSTFRLSLLPHHSDNSPARCVLFSIFIFIWLFALTSAYVLLADSQHPVLIARLSSSGRDPNTMHVLTSATTLARSGKLLSP